MTEPKSPSRRSPILAVLACIPGAFGFTWAFQIRPYLTAHFAQLSPPLKYVLEETTYWDHPLYVLGIFILFTSWAIVYQFRSRKHWFEYLFLAANCCFGLLCLLATFVVFCGPVPG